MKTSARNHFAGTVEAVVTGVVNDEIGIVLAGGHRIVATVTRESTRSLGLAEGCAAFALIKASSVIVATEIGTARLSARNRLAGRIREVTPGAVNTEVVIDVDGGLQVAGIITQASAATLGLVVGMPATAIFKSSSVIVGVEG